MPNDVTKQPLWIQSGDPETENMAPADDLQPGALGARITIKQPGPRGLPTAGGEAYVNKTYQKIQTDSTMSVSPFKGAVAWWADRAHYLVTTVATNRGARAGIFQFAITKGNIGYIQKAGPATVKFVDAPTAEPTAAGLFVIPSATAGKADCLAAASAATYPTLGLSAGTRDANSEAVVDLQIFDVP